MTNNVRCLAVTRATTGQRVRFTSANGPAPARRGGTTSTTRSLASTCSAFFFFPGRELYRLRRPSLSASPSVPRLTDDPPRSPTRTTEHRQLPRPGRLSDDKVYALKVHPETCVPEPRREARSREQFRQKLIVAGAAEPSPWDYGFASRRSSTRPAHLHGWPTFAHLSRLVAEARGGASSRGPHLVVLRRRTSHCRPYARQHDLLPQGPGDRRARRASYDYDRQDQRSPASRS